MDTSPLILIVDDQPELLETLADVLTQAGYEIESASNGAEALESAQQRPPDVLVTDVRMPVMDGYELVRRFREHPELRYTPILLLTSNDSTADLVAGLSEGADDYIVKPFNPPELLARLQAGLRTHTLYQKLRASHDTNRQLRSRLGETSAYGRLIGKSSGMLGVYELIDKVKNSDVPVMVRGESGTGKELIAEALHFQSLRAEAPFIAQNCSAFSENLLEAELFGHTQGAFTGAHRGKRGLFEEANNGTFFLDELGEMSATLQAKLLRVVQSGTFIPVGSTKEVQVNVRLVGATNRNLEEMVTEGTFREDLYYRLNVITIDLPPLRERIEDIPLLVTHFLEQIAARTGSPVKTLADGVMPLLLSHRWPGNIRELANEVERMNLMSGEAAQITERDLSQHLSPGITEEGEDRRAEGTLRSALDNLERSMIKSTLARTEGNKSEAARILGISRSSLIAKARDYDLG